ncbi:MAG: hypothetical protein AAF206_27705, partial [Bacteroidota bacterium]
LGIDDYHDFKNGGNTEDMLRRLRIVVEMAEEKGKISTMTLKTYATVFVLFPRPISFLGIKQTQYRELIKTLNGTGIMKKPVASHISSPYICTSYPEFRTKSCTKLS